MSKPAELSRFYEATAIPLCVADRDGHIRLTYPHMDEPFFPDEFAGYCIQDFAIQQRDQSVPLVLMMEPGYFIGIAKLEKGEYLIFGPAGPLVHTQNEILSFCKNVVYPEKLLEFCTIMHHTPIVPYRRFVSALSVAVQLMTKRAISTEEIVLCNNTVQNRDAEMEMKRQLFTQREDMVFHTPESYEVGVLSAVRSGDCQALMRRMLEPTTGRIGQMSKSLLVQEKYTFISFITLVTRAAIRGGLSTEVAYSLSDAYCQMMDDLVNVQDISTLCYRMALDFCQKVADEGGGKRYSAPVEKCLSYISQHLHEVVRLKDLSAISGYSERVLSRKFREETGLVLPDYIHGKRMQEAKYLLRHTEHSIAEIGSYLQYSSQSYFTKLFHEHTGQTPQQYRNSSQQPQG